MRKDKVLIVGDCHQRWDDLNSILAASTPDFCWVLGDFGFFPQVDNSYTQIEAGKTVVQFLDGNHEDHWSLQNLKNPEIAPNVFYMKRGTVTTLSDGRNVLWMGGASSIDKSQRTLGADYFPDEAISANDIYNLPDVEVDIVLSHTLPNEMTPVEAIASYKDPSTDALSYILERYQPSLWFGAHYHLYRTGNVKGCMYTVLDMIPNEGCFTWLPE